MKKLITSSMILLQIFCFVYAFETQSIYVGSGYSRISFSDGIICLVRSQPASVLVLTNQGKFIAEINMGLSYPVNAIHKDGMIFVTDYYKSSVMVYTLFGRLLKKIDVGRYPTTIKSSKNRIYVACSGDSSIYEINSTSLQVEERYTFNSASLYFEVFDGKIVYLYYFDSERTYQITTPDKKSKTVKIDNLRNPVCYFEKGSYAYILGYTDGVVVCLKDDKELWRVNLSDFARSMLLTDEYIVVVSLIDPVATMVSYDGKILKKISLPNVAHRVFKIQNKLIFLNHLPGQVYVYDLSDGSVQTIEIGTYAIDMVQISQDEVCILCSDSGELYILSL